MISVAIVTISDRSSRGEREDISGPAIKSWTQDVGGFEIVEEVIIPDEFEIIKSTLLKLCESEVMIILTTGGTGFSQRDVTPEATLAVIQRLVPGFTEAMRIKSLDITPHAMLSRAVSGIRGKSLIINLPGSPKAVRENLKVIQKALIHGIEILNAKITDCGSAE